MSLRILYIVSSTSEVGGASKSFINLLNGVKNSGHEVMVVCPDNNGMYKTLLRDNVRCCHTKYEFDITPVIKSLRDVALFIPRIIRRFLNNRISEKYLEKIIDEFGPDLIHTNVSPISVGYNVAKKLKIPHIFHVREYGDKDFDLHIRNIERKLTDSYTISITKDIAKYRNLTNPSKDIVIYNGIYPFDAIRYTEEKDSYFFYAGRLTEKKGIKMLLDAYLKYASEIERPLDLKIAGITPDMISRKLIDNYKILIDKKGLTNKIEWLGNVDNVNDYMFKATATIVPSFNEGFGRVVAEAMFNGSLVVGYNNAGIKEQFDNGVNVTGSEIGIRFNTIDELSDTMKRLTNQSEDLHSIIERSQVVVGESYSVESNYSKVIAFYHKILTE